MCQVNEVISFENTLKVLRTVFSSGLLTLESFVIYGKSGFKTKLEYIENQYFPFQDVGSIHAKFNNNETRNKVSVIIFSNMKLKISGGLSNVSADHMGYIERMTVRVTSYFSMTTASSSLSLINAQIKIKMSPVIFRKFLYSLQESRKFFSIKEPTLNGRGRISCAKVFPFNGRRGHFSVDPKGTVQLFGFKCIDEVNKSVGEFLDIADAHIKSISSD